MTVSKTSQAYLATAENLQGILQGVIVCVDPSIGSQSSQPGWAVYRESLLIASGIIPIKATLPIWTRLRQLANGVRKLYRDYDPDVLVYEDIPGKPFGFSNHNSHASLLKAVGVILSVPGPDGYVGIFPRSWKTLVRKDYVKGDEADAIELGYVIIQLAREIASREKGK